MKLRNWAQVGLATCLAGPALAQNAPAPADTEVKSVETIIVTGSSIRRQVETSALPLQIINRDDLKREGISSPEQLISYLTANVAGIDNLAANADVTENRGARGGSFANLRGQGSAGTLILLNGRRVAAHGINGGAVDINQLPIAAMQRIDVLKDGASAIYGTDAIGGVINFITRTDFQGLKANAFTDVTEQGGGNIYQASLLAGYGDISTQNFNIMATVSYRKNEELLASERDFIDTFQINRGLSVDTRGTPFGTIFPLATSATSPFTPNGTLWGTTTTAPLVPGSTTLRYTGGVNPLALPGGLGCTAIKDMDDYAEQLWFSPTNSVTASLACSWDTGEQASIQQEQETLNGLVRAVYRFGEHQIVGEFTASEATADNRFSHIQLTPNASAITGPDSTSLNFAYFRIPGVNDAIYDRIANALVAAFPTDTALAGRRALNLPIAMRWRCIECGRREISTTTTTNRFFLGADGPLPLDGWSYRVGASQATSEAESVLGSGYYYRNALTVNGVQKNNGIVNVFNSGVINPFLRPGETQTAAGLAALETASARGVRLFGGKFTVTQYDGSLSGPLFELPAGKVYAAVGVDFRTEEYEFNGDRRVAAERANILGAPFDDANALNAVSRDVKAVFAEVVVPVLDNLEITVAGRVDEYDGFGRTTNPKYAFKYRPLEMLLFRGSYSTGFRVPSFNQIYNGTTSVDLALGSAVVDPKTCPTLVVSTLPGCGNILDLGPVRETTGGNRGLGPEEAENLSLGFVLNFAGNATASVDWWRIERTGTIATLTRTQLQQNYNDFADKFVRDPASGRIVEIDRRILNAGGSLMEGMEISLRNSGEFMGTKWVAALDGTHIINRQSKLLPSAAYGPNEVDKWTRFQDLTLSWRHNAYVTLTRGDWSATFSQSYRPSYLDNASYLGIASGVFVPADYQQRVKSYTTYNTTVTYRGIKNMVVTGGIKNIFNTDPPFTLSYDSDLGSGSSWDPRVTDPRGRAFTLSVEYDF
ncbi:vitamin B12 transporter BtuB [Candidatus Phycosocius bacilliformis]|uniref:Vitamin B12 transporter BtuB n=1 Tax=Candidatus Phycosocius bacilliformis TaxID=1445552 RepID=A0A2P2E747_9PROT|nr:TonB-dependent receptor [Candidatus Phycosocius bacilliformis]GBF56886.1 vitamin B12 transporter BtuB [Candidatus Phycosocius bacilliformis]